MKNPVFNGIRVGSYVARYAGTAVLTRALVKDESQRRQKFIRNIGRYSRKTLEAMNFEIETVGYKPELFAKNNYLLISNHLSYLDILCLSSVHPSVFVTSIDMQQTFFLGAMAEMGGSLFIERRNRKQIEHDIEKIAGILQEGFDVVLYPEGTSHNGECVHPFKKSLLSSAIKAGVDIMPISIKYKEIDGKPFSKENRDKVCWYGDMHFANHLAEALKLKSVKVEIEFMDPIKVTEESSRHDLADKCFHAISESYGHPIKEASV